MESPASSQPLAPPQQPAAGTASSPSTPIAPQNYGLYGRLSAQARGARGGVDTAALFFITPGMGIFAVLAQIPLMIISMTAASIGSTYSSGPLALTSMLLMLLPAIAMLVGAVAGYFLARYLLLERFRRSYRETMQLLDTTQLPLLVADETFGLSIMEAVRDQLRFTFSGPPGGRKLEDQLLLSSCFIRALQLGQFTTELGRDPQLRLGSRRWWSTTPAARTLTIVGAVLSCGSCAVLFGPLMLVNQLSVAEQRGALAAICDFFCEAPGRCAK